MASGGRRAKNGPMSRQAKLNLKAIPAEEYTGEPPEWPIFPAATAKEELEWREHWHLPQAHVWALPEYRYLWKPLALYIRLLVKNCKSPGATLLAQQIRLGEQVGLTPNGLHGLGWKIATETETSEVPGQVASSASNVTMLSSARNRVKRSG